MTRTRGNTTKGEIPQTREKQGQAMSETDNAIQREKQKKQQEATQDEHGFSQKEGIQRGVKEVGIMGPEKKI